MAVRLSRLQGRYSLLLKREAWLDPHLLAPQLSEALSLSRPDAIRACRLQRGIVIQGAEQAAAEAACAVLTGAGVAALVLPDAEVPLLPKPVEVSVARIEQEGLATPSLIGTGMPKLWLWGDLALLSAGIVLDQKAASATGLLDKELMAEEEVRQAHVERQIERARTRSFPLKNLIERIEPDIAEAIKSAVSGKEEKGGKGGKGGKGKRSGREKAGTAQEEAEGFGEYATVLDFIFVRPFERLRVTHKSRLPDLARSAGRAKQLHLALAAIPEGAAPKKWTEAARTLAEGKDAGVYLFDDLNQFNDHSRWAYFQRLAE